jgi:tetratricopeptide (TPR) repeat protein
MGILLGLVGEIRKWDIASKVALAIAIILLIIDTFVLFTVPNLQMPALIGVVGLLISIQVIVLWGNRNLVTPYNQAQKAFVEGNFELARDILKADIDNSAKPPIDSLVLLGNAYRNLGQLRESESVLRIALARKPYYHFALYGLGKIRLVMGDYDEAIQHFEKALKAGSPEIIRFDKALAHYYLGENEQALAELEKMPDSGEIHRQAFSVYLFYTLKDARIDPRLVINGLPFWEAELGRFSNTVYGKALAEDVARMQELRSHFPAN